MLKQILGKKKKKKELKLFKFHIQAHGIIEIFYFHLNMAKPNFRKSRDKVYFPIF